LKTAVLRPSIVFGARDQKLAQRLLQGLDKSLVGDGENTLDFVHVVDVARAHVQCERALAKAPAIIGGKPYFVGSGRPTKAKEFFDFGFGAPQPVPVGVVRAFCALNGLLWAMFKVAPFSVWLYPESIDTITTNWWFPVDAAREAFGYDPASPAEAKAGLLSKRVA
jgi:nucleoside-diphosphate-sugar epimerase